MNQPNVLHAPWEADGHHVIDAYSVTVATVGLASRTRDDAQEIARLIAAAPEMLNALCNAVVALEEGENYQGEILEVVAGVREAIAEATGVQP